MTTRKALDNEVVRSRRESLGADGPNYAFGIPRKAVFTYGLLKASLAQIETAHWVSVLSVSSLVSISAVYRDVFHSLLGDNPFKDRLGNQNEDAGDSAVLSSFFVVKNLFTDLWPKDKESEDIAQDAIGNKAPSEPDKAPPAPQASRAKELTKEIAATKVEDPPSVPAPTPSLMDRIKQFVGWDPLPAGPLDSGALARVDAEKRLSVAEELLPQKQKDLEYAKSYHYLIMGQADRDLYIDSAATYQIKNYSADGLYDQETIDPTTGKRIDTPISVVVDAKKKLKDAEDELVQLERDVKKAKSDIKKAERAMTFDADRAIRADNERLAKKYPPIVRPSGPTWGDSFYMYARKNGWVEDKKKEPATAAAPTPVATVPSVEIKKEVAPTTAAASAPASAPSTATTAPAPKPKPRNLFEQMADMEKAAEDLDKQLKVLATQQAQEETAEKEPLLSKVFGKNDNENIRFRNNSSTSPERIAAEDFPDQARTYQRVFYEPDGKGRTYRQVIRYMQYVDDARTSNPGTNSTRLEPAKMMPFPIQQAEGTYLPAWATKPKASAPTAAPTETPSQSPQGDKRRPSSQPTDFVRTSTGLTVAIHD